LLLLWGVWLISALTGGSGLAEIVTSNDLSW
jgi:hypothetical protein